MVGAVEAHRDYVAEQTLAVDVRRDGGPKCSAITDRTKAPCPRSPELAARLPSGVSAASQCRRASAARRRPGWRVAGHDALASASDAGTAALGPGSLRRRHVPWTGDGRPGAPATGIGRRDGRDVVAGRPGDVVGRRSSRAGAAVSTVALGQQRGRRLHVLVDPRRACRSARRAVGCARSRGDGRWSPRRRPAACGSTRAG